MIAVGSLTPYQKEILNRLRAGELLSRWRGPGGKAYFHGPYFQYARPPPGGGIPRAVRSDSIYQLLKHGEIESTVRITPYGLHEFFHLPGQRRMIKELKL